jgi:hypothetical protein
MKEKLARRRAQNTLPAHDLPVTPQAGGNDFIPMLTAHEILGFMSPALAVEILDYMHTSEKDVYRATLLAVAEAKKVRPLFLERKPRADRHRDMVSVLVKPQMEFVALNVLQTWLLKKQTALVMSFLDSLDIKHNNGMVDDLPESVPDDKLKAAVDNLLAKFPREHVAVYLRAFTDLNDVKWPLLSEMLDKDERLQMGA